ncbi:MAG: hypothetical protein ACRCUS_08270 [Anaerovoracaceae bacterium]
MFLREKELRAAFWKNYNYNNRAIKYQFESELREGGTDLVTIEKYQDNFQINAFEFKLTDIKKVLLQAKGNLPFVNKSWIVLPHEKKELMLTKYRSYLIEQKNIGVIIVEEGGRWEMIHRPMFQKEIKLNEAIVKLMMRGY